MAAAGRETGTAGAIVQVPLPTAPECAKPSESSCGDGRAEADGVGEAEEAADADGEGARLADARAEDWAVACDSVADGLGRSPAAGRNRGGVPRLAG